MSMYLTTDVPDPLFLIVIGIPGSQTRLELSEEEKTAFSSVLVFSDNLQAFSTVDDG